MRRREFISRSAAYSLLPMLIGGFTVKAFGRSPLLESLVAAATETDRVLVLIQLNGGNDGLNTVIPLSEYTNLSKARAGILIPEAKVLKLTDATGLHPSLSGLADLYANGRLAIVQSVGYPNPSYSHFRATDIWLTASDANQNLSSGWMGRYLNEEYPQFPDAYPNTVMPDPLAIQIGSSISPGLQGPEVSMGMTITDPTKFYQLVTGMVDPAPNTPAGHELTFIRQVSQQTQQYAAVIKNAASKAANLSTRYPSSPDHTLGDQLKVVARLIAGGLKTRIYVVTLGGFDTHSNQVVAGATETGTHATLLGRLSKAIAAFQDDLALLKVDHRVVGMTFSEFGRRILSNASGGTDHGSAAPLIVFGKGINAGIIGSNPIIPSTVTAANNLPMQYDFRSVYASILRDWFGVPQQELESVLLRGFQSLPIIAAPTGVGRTAITPDSVTLRQNYPNPFNPSTRLQFTVADGPVQIKLFNSAGQEVMTIREGSYPAGTHEVWVDGSSLSSGVYYCRLQQGAEVRTIMMTLIR
ncbi:MAG: DUF1501 domain-containing protein [Bacteroidetes bacterium]|nr:DUF1501 domain-containing protein [Bacteroidota bacterium]